jgi:hypothetical protein
MSTALTEWKLSGLTSRMAEHSPADSQKHHTSTLACDGKRDGPRLIDQDEPT